MQQEEEITGKSSGCARERCSPTALGAGLLLLCYAMRAAPPTGKDRREMVLLGSCGGIPETLCFPSHLLSGRCGRQGPSVPCSPSKSQLRCCTDGRGRQNDTFRAQPATS